MRDCITGRALCKVAERTAELHGLKCPTREELWKMINTTNKYPLPIITNCDNGMLWVDRYYVAYQLGDGDVVYTYLTRHHIAEECAAYRHASDERGEKVVLPADIRKCFVEAKRILKENNMNYWLSEILLKENAE